MSTKFFCFLQVLILYLQIATAIPIIGKAYPAKYNEFPFIVSLSHDSNYIEIENHICGGALISRRHVLTAEHCIEDLKTNEVTVIARTTEFNSGQAYKVKSWITYDQWMFSQNRLPEAYMNDIAIITLIQNVKNVEPAKISKVSHSKLFGEPVVTAGWGFTDEVEGIVPGSLLKVNLTILYTKEVEKNYYKIFGMAKRPEHNLYFTTADPPAILGCGDSGSPLLLRSTKEIVGVNQGRCNLRNAYTDRYAMSRHVKLLDDYKKFIQEITKQ